MNTAATPLASSGLRRSSLPIKPDPFMDQVIALLPTLRALGRSLCGDAMRADDLVQDTVIKAHLHREKFRPASNLRAWLFTILRNCYFSEQRRRKFEIADPESTHAARQSVSPNHDAKLQVRELDRALERLPSAQREVLLLVCADGIPYSEAAEICGVAVGTIKSRIARARHELSRRIGENVLEPDTLQRAWSQPVHFEAAVFENDSAG